MYREIEPSEQLSSYIESYWISSKVKENHTSFVEPDGCFDIVIHFHNGINEVYLTGIWDKPIMVNSYKNVDLLGIRFYPKALQAFFNISIGEIKNTSTKVHKQMFKSSIDIELLYNSKNIDELISFFDVFFLSMLEENKTIIHQFLDELDYNSDVDCIADKIGVSRRHLCRELKNKLGITTKAYMNIIRFISAKRMLLHGKSYTEIVYKCGYYDQSHFIKEFKKYTGKNPSNYIK